MAAKTARRLAILVSTILVAGCSLFFIQRYQLARMDQSVLARAMQAEREGDFVKAADLYQEHLEIAPDDQDAKLKYADVLLKESKDIGRQDQALELYVQLLTRYPARKDIRRRLAELAMERSRYDLARPNLEILLRTEGDDGSLHFYLGECQELDGSFGPAVKSYRSAVEKGAPERLEAYRRQADLLRSQLNRPDEADAVIDAMVQSDPKNYRVYLERGRYHRRFIKTQSELESVKQDFQRALKQMPGEGDTYVELAEIAAASGKLEESRQVLEAGLKAVPKESSIKLHEALAILEARAGSMDKAIERLRQSISELPDQPVLHWDLANFLADRGDTTELAAQIEELRRLRYAPLPIEFLEAYHKANSRDWKNARATLTRLQPFVELNPGWKARVNNLLGRCYEHLGESERRKDAYRRAVLADPGNIQAQMGLADSLLAGGEIDRAIGQYRKLAQPVPQVRGPLVRLLIAKNQTAPPGQQNWTEIDDLIKATKEYAPQSSEWIILQADLLLAKGKVDAAETLVNEARLKSPLDAEVWVKSAELLRRRRRFAEAMALLDQVPKEVNSVNLPLERARILLEEGPPDLPKALGALAENTSSLPRDARRLLLEALAQEIAQLKDFPRAKELLLEVAQLDPKDVDPQLRLIDLAFQASSETDIKRQIDKIKELEGPDGPIGGYQEIRYTIWQAQRTTSRSEQEALRRTARQLINDLSTRRPDWPQVFLALAQLDEQELAQPGLDPSIRKDKQYEAATHYLRAIELGQRNLAIIRRATDLLYASGHPTDVTQLWNQLPASTIGGLDLQQQVTAEAFRNRDYERAAELAQKAKAASPNDFLKRIQLVQVLLASQRRDEAEAELRSAISAARGDSDRWFILVQFLCHTSQMQKAEAAIRDAETALKKQSPLGIARCCEVLAQAYKAAGADLERTKSWYDKATQWYREAQRTKPVDPAITHQLIEFLIRSGQSRDVETQLTAILEKDLGTDPQTQREAAWARRSLAFSLLLNANDYGQCRKALAVVEPIAKAVEERRRSGKGSPVPEDLRILATVYEAQQNSADHQKARALLEELINANADLPRDRYALAVIYSKDGLWDKARDQFRALLAQIENTRDVDLLSRRPDYYTQFISELLRHFQAGHDQQDLVEAGELIEKLKLLRSDTVSLVELEARFYKAQNQISKAVELIETTAKRPALPEGSQQPLARLAEDLGQADLAERLLRNLIARSPLPRYRLALAEFLARRGRVKEALDECEGLWKTTTNPEELVQGTLNVLLGSGSKRDPAQVNQVALWLENGLKQKPGSSMITNGLANVREWQGNFPEAEALYRQGIDRGENDVIALNNLAWLLALRNDQGSAALDLINRAIARRGPLPELLDTRGVVYMVAGDSRRAIEDLNQATILDPTGPKLFHLAQAYLRASNKADAAQTMAKARAKGLAPDLLHPLEVTAYNRVLSELGVR
jgi:tetratricopeptide (TPR) repeat protein